MQTCDNLLVGVSLVSYFKVETSLTFPLIRFFIVEILLRLLTLLHYQRLHKLTVSLPANIILFPQLVHLLSVVLLKKFVYLSVYVRERQDGNILKAQIFPISSHTLNDRIKLRNPTAYLIPAFWAHKIFSHRFKFFYAKKFVRVCKESSGCNYQIAALIGGQATILYRNLVKSFSFKGYLGGKCLLNADNRYCPERLCFS